MKNVFKSLYLAAAADEFVSVNRSFTTLYCRISRIFNVAKLGIVVVVTFILWYV